MIINKIYLNRKIFNSYSQFISQDETFHHL